MTDTFESVLPTSNIDMGSVASTTISPKILITNPREGIISNDDFTTATTPAATVSNDIIEESSKSITTETELAEEMAIVIKRKRGRPRKTVTKPKVVPTGRKRGRPPKVKEPITTTVTTATDTIIKRKPGRPKKVVSNQELDSNDNKQGKGSSSANKDEEKPDKVIKRKRGRPSKIKRSPGRPRKLQLESKGITVSTIPTTTTINKSRSSTNDSSADKRGRSNNDIQKEQGRGRQRTSKLDDKEQVKKRKNDTTKTTTTPKVKRGRGRPPKSKMSPDQTSNIVNEFQQLQETSTSSSAPPLEEDHAIDNQNISVQNNVVSGENNKRKRGRPKKQTTGTIVPVEKKVKRGRGRPKKQLVTDNNVDDDMVLDESSSDAVTEGLEIGINMDNESTDIVPLMFADNDINATPVTTTTASSLSMETEIPKIIVTNEKGSDRIYGSSKKKRSKSSDTDESSKKRAKHFNQA